MNERESLRRYFQNIAGSFDAFYSRKRPIFFKALDLVFHQSMYRRFAITLKECGNFREKEALDIGCGSGRYSVAIAKQGVAKVTGIDFSNNMLKLAKDLVEENGLKERCEFIQADFLEYDFSKKFHLCLAIGVFDYLKEPLPFLVKIHQLTLEKAIISFPKKWHIWTISRKIRLKILGCLVYFYTPKQIKNLLEKSGFKNYSLNNLGRDYLVTAWP